jgi:spore coat protein CotH
MLIGYARVSTVDQNLALQRDALTEAGCAKIFTEQMSGAVTDRPALHDALEFARSAPRDLSSGAVAAGHNPPTCSPEEFRSTPKPLKFCPLFCADYMCRTTSLPTAGIRRCCRDA